MKINHPIKGRIDYEPYEFQEELINAILEGKNIIVKSARQMGTSTTMFYCIRELCLKNPGYKALLVTSSGYGIEGLNYKSPLDSEIKNRSKYKIEFKNGSVIEFSPGTKLDENKKDYDVYFDLFEFISNSLKENVSNVIDNEKIKFYSFTGNNEFEKEDFEVIRWNWDLDKSRDEIWKNDMIRILGQRSFDREFEVN